MTAYTSSTSAEVTVNAPAGSKERTRASFRLSISITGARTSATAATGTLIQKTHCQPSVSVMRPPSSSPAVAPSPPIPPQMPSALFRSAPSVKVFITMDRAAGAMVAADTPCRARAATSTSADGANPHPSEASTRSDIPARKTLRRPSRSAARPHNSSRPTKASA
ncbi:hypothetical protein GT204_07045 [Streptomyces sp. SID4919]|uniref:hypothetical protein n=1 Tax=Streptomyces sp. SID4919 TaxID=2690270 RepID=UPI000C076C43|nr:MULTISPECIES: hypothetical protein [unclassified Streptomyces]MYY08664.1 hypothetical protein [Streptomyces sp. SID4919]